MRAIQLHVHCCCVSVYLPPTTAVKLILRLPAKLTLKLPAKVKLNVYLPPTATTKLTLELTAKLKLKCVCKQRGILPTMREIKTGIEIRMYTKWKRPTIINGFPCNCYMILHAIHRGCMRAK